MRLHAEPAGHWIYFLAEIPSASRAHRLNCQSSDCSLMNYFETIPLLIKFPFSMFVLVHTIILAFRALSTSVAV